jgi:long-subunit acyl-CoA synthetase (AMP-forming)
MTELGIAANNPPTGLDKLGSIGLPNPGFVFSIRADQGGETPDGQEGRVFITAPSCSLGYWNDPKATAEVFDDGWLDTGDI